MSKQLTLNKIERLDDGTIKMFLTRGEFTLLDPEDYEKIKDRRWVCIKNRKTLNATNILMIDGIRNQISLPRDILKCSDDQNIFYVNSDSLDNRRSNLKLILKGAQVTLNEIEVVGDGTTKIFLQTSNFTVIDSEDYDRVSHIRWYERMGYARSIKKIDGISKYINLHRLIINSPDHLQVDHKNHNTLDNRKCNLRHASNSQNNMNRRKSKNKSSIYKGVCWNKRDEKWQSNIKNIHEPPKYLGLFDKEEDAAKAYNDKAKELFGEYALLNKIE